MADATNEPVLEASDHITNYFKTAAPLLADNQRVKITAAVMELLRFTSGAAVVAQCDPALARIGLIELLGELCGIEWEKIPFSITKTALGSPDPTSDVFEALKTFANVIQADAALGTEEVFRSLFTVAEQPAAPPLQPKRAPKVAASADVAKIFTRSPKFKPDCGVELLNWQSEYPNGGMGPQLWGLRFAENEDQVQVLLETGELVNLPAQIFTLARTTEPADFSAVPLELLAAARSFWPGKEAELDTQFGQFTRPLYYCPYGAQAIAALRDVANNPASYPPPNAAAVTLSVDGTPYFVTLETRASKTGVYVTAKLIDAAENIVMRLDKPRQFSDLGVYLFPLPDMVIALAVKER
jgi:hypothetical protein